MRFFGEDTSWQDLAAVGAILTFLWMILKRVFTWVSVIERMEKIDTSFKAHVNENRTRLDKQDKTLETHSSILRSQDVKLDTILRIVDSRKVERK